ncbi:AraC family transcriptional regulator [Nevskia sp.]|uniref:AraC family transcriptional regulator n=1 Tax=Nevskia sp. TaxID=1929292 RepID=UPI0025E4068F|nr:AraC family transcriptional regulator [Nevskia sp.]
MQGQVSATYVRLLHEYLAARGHDAVAVLGEAAPVVDGSGLARVAIDHWAALLDRADAVLGETAPEPALGLAVGAGIGPSHLGVLGYLSLHCRDLADALSRLRDYERLVYDVNPGRLLPLADSVVLEWGDERGRPGQRVDECAIAALIAYARNITARPDAAPLAVSFINPAPPSMAPYEAFFRCPVTFAAPTTTVRLPFEWLAAPLRQPDDALRALLDQQAGEQLARLPPVDDFERRLRETLAGALRDGDASLAACAARLHCSTRTLQRRLEAAGSSFQAALDDTRRQLATGWLADPRLRLIEISQLLGYTDQAAFTRAFVRWTGQAPGQWRRARAVTASGSRT